MNNQLLLSILAGALLLLAPNLTLARMIGVIMPAADIPYYVAIQKGVEAELDKEGVTVVPFVAPSSEADQKGWQIFARRSIPYLGSIKEGRVAALEQKGQQVVEIAVQRPLPNTMSWKNSTRKLIALDAKLILTYGAGTTLAALSETKDLPLVFCNAFDPVASGITEKNTTGVPANAPLKELVAHLRKMTNFSKLGVLFSSDEADSVRQAAAAEGLGLAVVKIDAVQGVDSIALPGNIQGLLLTCAGVVQNQKAIKKIVAKAQAAKIATASVLGGSAELGILISMAVSVDQQAKEVAKLVSAVMKGAPPATLPPVNTSKPELTINLAEAEALGLNVPFEIIATAKVIK